MNDAANRSEKCNCHAKLASLNGGPHLLLILKKKICAGDEIRYDYGGKDLPWKKVLYCVLVITSVNHVLLYVTFTFLLRTSGVFYREIVTVYAVHIAYEPGRAAIWQEPRVDPIG